MNLTETPQLWSQLLPGVASPMYGVLTTMWRGLVADPSIVTARRYVGAIEDLYTLVDIPVHDEDFTAQLVATALAPTIDTADDPVLAIATKVSSVAGILDATRLATLHGALIPAVVPRLAAPDDIGLLNITRSVVDALAFDRESDLERVRRVFGGLNNAELGELLGVTHTTIGNWSRDSAPTGQNASRLRSLSRVAELIDEYIDPRDVARYINDVPVPALDDRTIRVAVADEPEQVLRVLSDALVW